MQEKKRLWISRVWLNLRRNVNILIKSVNSLIVKSLLLLCLPQQSYWRVFQQPYSQITVIYICLNSLTVKSVSSLLIKPVKSLIVKSVNSLIVKLLSYMSQQSHCQVCQ